MGEIARPTFFQIGLHSSTSDWTTMPSTDFAEPESGVEIVTDYEETARDLERGDGEEYTSLNGHQVGEINGLRIPLLGLSGSGAGDGVAVSSLSFGPAEHMLVAAAGAAFNDSGTGDTSDGTDAGTGTTVTGTSPSLTGGDAILVQGTTSGVYDARWVESVATNDITVCRALTDKTGGADTADEGTVIYAGNVVDIDPAAGNHTHLAFDAEGLNWRRQFVGCLGNQTINIPAGGYATIGGSFPSTEWSDVAEANPTYSAPTQGSHIRGIECPLWIGSTLYMAHDISFDFGLTVVPRMSDGAPQGKWGFVVERKRPVLSFKLQAGTLTAPSEVTDAQLGTWQGSQTADPSGVDLLLQVGRTAGAAMAIRMRAADLRIRRVREGGQYKMQCTAAATRPSSGAACSIAIF